MLNNKENEKLVVLNSSLYLWEFDVLVKFGCAGELVRTVEAQSLNFIVLDYLLMLILS